MIKVCLIALYIIKYKNSAVLISTKFYISKYFGHVLMGSYLLYGSEYPNLKNKLQ